MNVAYLGLGGNLGDRAGYLHRAMQYIKEQIGDLRSSSAFYVSAPQGFASDNYFLNAVVKVLTPLTPSELLSATQGIERALGRSSKSHAGAYADRVIDIDILLYADRVVRTGDLVIPHPLLPQRSFVLTPLCEIAPDLVHPVLKLSVRQLYTDLWQKSPFAFLQRL